MYKCILCGSKCNDDVVGFVCPECNEAFMYYKNQYMAKKLLETSTELDEAMFEKLYSVMNIDELIIDDANSPFPDEFSELYKDIKDYLVENRYNSDMDWLNQQEGRFDNFLKFIEKKAFECYKKVHE